MDKSFAVVFMFILTHLGVIFFLYPEDIIASTPSGHWVLILFEMIVHFAAISMYMKGLSSFPGWDIIRIYMNAGKTVAIFFLLPVTLYLLVVIIIAVRAYSEVITIIFLSNTPLWSIIILLLFVSTYLALKGVNAIFRTGVLVGTLSLPLILIISLTSFQNVDWNYVFPLFDQGSFSFLTTSSYLKSFFAYAGGFLYLGFVPPFFTYQRKKVLLAIVALTPFFILSVYVPLLTFGEATAATLHFPLVVVFETISIPWLMFDRVTMFFMFTLIAFSMIFISLVLWETNQVISQCIPFVKPKYLLIFLSVFIFIICLTIHDWETVEKLLLWNSPLRLFVLVTVPLSIFYLGLRAKRRVGHAHN
ncbi:GerAB/ArcD/ProY family transporter [Paenibacillus sp. Soil750]|uniref:GerAB/ArcD/ProY family transporter n=1 Tax=Paenibacillus sp. Soil750 TaxID=1736398 RepID=UPI0006F261E9|nr:GerAB/ArcD/ProY family transporter [Paenibacillus sp. Soil750]KRE55955.1 hypothetical protein ASL11_35070 [Paenibacillus sp. Soil750]